MNRSVAAAIPIFVALALVILLMQSLTTLVSVTIALGLTTYLLLVSRHPRKPREDGRHIPSVFGLIALLLPFAFLFFLLFQ